MTVQSVAHRYFMILDRQGKTFNIVAGLLCTVLLGCLDYYSDIITGVDYTLAIFYLLPVSFVAWFSGTKAGTAISLFSVLTRMSIQLNSVDPLPLFIWKNGSSLGFFLVTTVLIAKIRQLLDHERLLSRTDHLTNAVNSRAFMEALSYEIYRQGRHSHPFGLAYIDIDDFKGVNDNFGHAVGDIVLKSVVETISDNLRQTDIIARLGGDEFAVLFPDTGAEAGSAAMAKICKQLQLSMGQHAMPITFSIGLLSCPEQPESANDVIKYADNLMYEVKKNGKNSILHAVYA